MTLRVADMPHRLGWQPAPPDPRTLRAGRYFTADLPAPPKVADWLSKVSAYPMLLNDQLGDCEPVAICHLRQALTAYTGQPWTPTDRDALDAYEAIAGYRPDAQPNPDGSNPTDTGCTSRGTLNYWRQTGLAGHKILAYAEVNLADHDEVRAAVNLFGGLLVAVNLPLTAGPQTRRGQAWRPMPGPGGEPGSWGGHAIHVGGYGARYLDCITWARRQRMTWAFLARYGLEAYAVVAPEWVDPASGKSPTGLDVAGLLADLHTVTS